MSEFLPLRGPDRRERQTCLTQIATQIATAREAGAIFCISPPEPWAS
jgi:hypothetical protein